MRNKKLLATFIFFLTALFLGWLLRLQFVHPITSIQYKHLLHAHSHVILLGWVFNALFISITSIYHPKGSDKHKKIKYLFWFIQATILLAMIGFLREGYAFFSILFSTLFLVGTFIWAAWLWPDLRKDRSIGGRFIFLSILLLLLSSLGPLSLGGIMSTSLKDTAAYPLSIYFYLHFLYNGFFIFGLIGVGFHVLDKKKIIYQKEYAERFYSIMKWTIIPLYALSAVWLDENIWINIVGALAAILQIWGGYYLYKVLKSMTGRLESDFIRSLLIKIVFFIFGVKLILQLLSSIQWVADVSLDARSYLIIGYIHLVMLGLISLFILWYFLHKKWITLTSRWSRIGIYLFLFGILLSEVLLFTQGFLTVFTLGQLPAYFLSLLVVSGLMPLGILLLIRGQFTKSKYNLK